MNINQDADSFKPRKPLYAFLLSLFLPGMGQVYNGKLLKGLIFFVILLLLPVIFALFNAQIHFNGFLTLCVVTLILRIYLLIDAVRDAKAQKEYLPKSYNFWYKHLIIAGLMVSSLFLIDPADILGVESFKITNGSGIPVFELGDRVIADKRAYKKSKPAYGDLIVYQADNGLAYVSRIMALPGDRIAILGNIVMINGKEVKETFIKEFSVGRTVYEYEEELPGGKKISTYKVQNTKLNNDMSGIVVPQNSYFVLGDNRDYSEDSRFHGFVSQNSIIGRIVFSYWGQSSDRINIDFSNR